MLDTVLRPWIDRPLNAAGRLLARRGISANAVTLTGLGVALAAAAALASGLYTAGCVLIAINRIIDGLDGAVARTAGVTDSGGYLDTVCDYVFYASVPLGFAVADPEANALAAAALLAAFCLTATSFLTFAIIAAKRGMTTRLQGEKSFFYSFGLVEGTETIAFFLLAALLPGRFAMLAWIFSALCVLTALQRTMLALHTFHEDRPDRSPP